MTFFSSDWVNSSSVSGISTASHKEHNGDMFINVTQIPATPLARYFNCFQRAPVLVKLRSWATVAASRANCDAI